MPNASTAGADFPRDFNTLICLRDFMPSFRRSPSQGWGVAPIPPSPLRNAPRKVTLYVTRATIFGSLPIGVLA